MYAGVPVIAEIITFAINRPRHLTINEILVRPTGPPAHRPTGPPAHRPTGPAG